MMWLYWLCFIVVIVLPCVLVLALDCVWVACFLWGVASAIGKDLWSLVTKRRTNKGLR